MPFRRLAQVNIFQKYVAVIGGGEAGETVLAMAFEVGREITRRGAVLLCGGLGGVMQAAAGEPRRPEELPSASCRDRTAGTLILF
jgi:predicted Rossmann-fold nucleotide-binding protein